MTTQTLKNQFIKGSYLCCSIDDVVQQVDCIIEKIYLKQDFLFQEQHNICIEAVKYHLDTPGQRVRARACLDVCMKLGVHYDDMLILAATSELLHNASLIHDDIQDEDEIRRGQPSVWKKYGTKIGICAGDLLISTAYGVLAGYSKTSQLPRIISRINNQTIAAIEGQSLDIIFKNNQKLSIEEYTNIATQKSGALLSLPIELAFIAAEREECLILVKQACANLAVGYQIADDLEDVIKDSGTNSTSASVNITFILKDMAYKEVQQSAIALCHQYLDDSIYYASKLPDNTGIFLIDLANTLKNKIRY